jgi:hypothetical protein
VALFDPGGAENRDAVVDVAQSVKAALDLGVDAAEAQIVRLLDVAGSAQQQLVALPRGDVTRGAYLAPKVTRLPFRLAKSAPDRIRTGATRLKG